MTGRVLIIAGSDSGGGAGIQADIKTVTMLGGYAATAITAVTVQNTLGVVAVHALPVDLVRDQAIAVLDDIGADMIKTGMLGGADVVEAVAELLESRDLYAVVDPVMAAKDGSALIAPRALETLMRRLAPRACLFTPNVPEAERMLGRALRSPDDLAPAGHELLKLGPKAVLMKGGHLPGDRLVDVLVTAAGVKSFEGERLPSRHTHGTGCTLASACATFLAAGLSLEDAVAGARRYVAGAIKAAPGLGAGAGPLGHGWLLRTQP
jgi:hydroxymethylpyrimidine/phosphomethylpyrimidine kinase